MTSKKINLYLPVEIVARELDSKLLICAHALNKGFRVYIGSKNEIYKLALTIGSGAYLGKDHGPQSRDTYKNLYDAGVNIYCLDEEGFIFHSEEEYQKRVDIDVFSMATGIFLWGENQRNTIKRITSESTEKLIIVGNPRFDILSAHLRFHFWNKPTDLEKFDKYIFVSSMFAAGNWEPLMYGTKDYVDHQFSRGKIKSPEDELFYRSKQQHTANLFNEYIEAIKCIATKFPAQSIVIRPHPDEKHSSWFDAFDSFKNIFVRYEGSAKDWMLRANCVVYTGCTTGIEAWALGVPTINYQPFGSSAYESQLPNKFAKNVRSRVELNQEISMVLSGKYEFPTIDSEFVRGHIDNVFTSNAAKKIVSNISDSNNSDQKKLTILKFFKRCKYFIKEVYLRGFINAFNINFRQFFELNTSARQKVLRQKFILPDRVLLHARLQKVAAELSNVSELKISSKKLNKDLIKFE